MNLLALLRSALLSTRSFVVKSLTPPSEQDAMNHYLSQSTDIHDFEERQRSWDKRLTRVGDLYSRP